MKDIRYVILHSPGPAWEPGKNQFDQAGVREHVEHYRKLLAEGKLEMGGPHLDEGGGGMMIPTADVDEAEIRRFACSLAGQTRAAGYGLTFRSRCQATRPT